MVNGCQFHRSHITAAPKLTHAEVFVICYVCICNAGVFKLFLYQGMWHWEPLPQPLPPIARQAYPQLYFNVHLQGWTENQYQLTAMTQSASESTLRAKTLAECSCSTPSVVVLPSRLVQDMRLHHRTLLGSPYLHSSPVPLPSDPRVALQHQAKPERVENSLSSLLHVYGSPVKMWTRCGSAGGHLTLGTCRSTLGTVKMII
jgi:hypothetical protein